MMPETEIPSEVDIRSYEGLTRLFRFGISLRRSKADRTALADEEARFKLSPYIPAARGALEDTVRHIDQLDDHERFTKICQLIAAASDPKDLLDADLSDELVRISNANDIVRFSFTPTILPCLLLAWEARKRQRRTYPMYAIRYSGVGSDVHLMAFASLFLKLPIFVEFNPPWDPDEVFNSEGDREIEGKRKIYPDLEISFPPAEFRAEQAPLLEDSMRKFKLPRAVDRGKYDLESVMLNYLNRTESAAFAFVSKNFTTSTKQSRLRSRQKLLKSRRINRLVDLVATTPPLVLIELDSTDGWNDAIKMETADHVEGFLSKRQYGRQIRGKYELISADQISSSGDSLDPKRYLSKGPVGGRGIGEVFRNVNTPSTHRLADLFEIIRPKTTRNNPTGNTLINEIRPSDLSDRGDLSGTFRKINMRKEQLPSLMEQKVQVGDILFAHRGPVGRVGYVTHADAEGPDMWAAQSLLILRSRKTTSSTGLQTCCDPRVLFMYLLAPKVRDSWTDLAVGDRSPAIPIGEIERFGLPRNLLTSLRPFKPSKFKRVFRPDSYSTLIVDDFERRQAALLRIRDIEAEMERDLDQAWNLSWRR